MSALSRYKLHVQSLLARLLVLIDCDSPFGLLPATRVPDWLRVSTDPMQIARCKERKAKMRLFCSWANSN